MERGLQFSMTSASPDLQGSQHQKVQSNQPGVAETIDTSSDSIGYLADMIAELQVIADKSGLRLLAALLGLAHAEASSQQDQRLARLQP